MAETKESSDSLRESSDILKDAVKNYLWTEKYRPQTVEDCILPTSTKNLFRQQRDSGVVQNMLLFGGHGMGKSTVSLALCKEINADVLFMNCSKDNSVADVRTKIFNFASSMSLTGNHRVFLGDEFDYISKEGQAALRGVIESTANSCRFIFTCNFVSKIIDPLKSRLQMVDFKIQPEQKADLATQFMKRCIMILETEGVKFDKKALAFLIQKHYPDFRKVIQELQRAFNSHGKIDESIMMSSSGEISEYIKALKAKDFKAARKWIAETYTTPEDFFKSMYRHIYDIFAQDSIAQAILTLNGYQIKHVTAIDPELNMSALTIELMSQCQTK